ncbi:hypothetical protein C7N43_35765 [Sphingobacteriales bacterium UPWRP_1]|nr:hypothetical protein BVG80_00585 [Sphingobacteriales bacterium TSM_CSM]PSJ72135.1 hypothetical protein C7N43_35765 [Sphingobacteriales bacterium UPWRP_1]
MPENKFLKLIILLLVLLNAGMLGIIWLRKPPPHLPGGGKSAAVYLTKELGFTSQQEEQYQKMHRQHHQTVDSIRTADQEIRQRLFDLLQTNLTDTTDAAQLANSLGNNRAKTEWVTFTHFKEVKQLCTPEQQIKFNRVIDEALRMLKPPPQR